MNYKNKMVYLIITVLILFPLFLNTENIAFSEEKTKGESESKGKGEFNTTINNDELIIEEREKEKVNNLERKVTFEFSEILSTIYIENPYEDPESTEIKKKELIEKAIFAFYNKDAIREGNTLNPNNTVPIVEDSDNSTDITPIIENFSSKYSIDKELIAAVIEHESSFEINAEYENANGSIDRGLMQLNSGTVPWLAEETNHVYKEGIEFDPLINIELGTYYLNYLKSINSDLHYILTAYNKGPTGATEWYEKNGTFESDYSKHILSLLEGA